jgi:F-type H+-transporting ATPase subunit epsilon
MTTLREGRIHVHSGSDEQVYEVKGGFADVTPEGLTILAEEAVEVA